MTLETFGFLHFRSTFRFLYQLTSGEGYNATTLISVLTFRNL
jgi:hypothetical protein